MQPLQINWNCRALLGIRFHLLRHSFSLLSSAHTFPNPSVRLPGFRRAAEPAIQGLPISGKQLFNLPCHGFPVCNVDCGHHHLHGGLRHVWWHVWCRRRTQKASFSQGWSALGQEAKEGKPRRKMLLDLMLPRKTQMKKKNWSGLMKRKKSFIGLMKKKKSNQLLLLLKLRKRRKLNSLQKKKAVSEKEHSIRTIEENAWKKQGCCGSPGRSKAIDPGDQKDSKMQMMLCY